MVAKPKRSEAATAESEQTARCVWDAVSFSVSLRMVINDLGEQNAVDDDDDDDGDTSDSCACAFDANEAAF